MKGSNYTGTIQDQQEGVFSGFMAQPDLFRPEQSIFFSHLFEKEQQWAQESSYHNQSYIPDLKNTGFGTTNPSEEQVCKVIKNESNVKLEDLSEVQDKEATNRKIEFSKKALEKRETIMKGYPGEKSNIGKHLKKVTTVYLDVLYYIRHLGREQIQLVKQFKASHGSLSAFQRLYSNENIKRQTLKHFSSSYFIKDILKSSKMLKSKISMIRHLKILSQFCLGQSTTWKSEKK